MRRRWRDIVMCLSCGYAPVEDLTKARDRQKHYWCPRCGYDWLEPRR